MLTTIAKSASSVLERIAALGRQQKQIELQTVHDYAEQLAMLEVDGECDLVEADNDEEFARHCREVCQSAGMSEDQFRKLVDRAVRRRQLRNRIGDRNSRDLMLDCQRLEEDVRAASQAESDRHAQEVERLRRMTDAFEARCRERDQLMTDESDLRSLREVSDREKELVKKLREVNQKRQEVELQLVASYDDGGTRSTAWVLGDARNEVRKAQASGNPAVIAKAEQYEQNARRGMDAVHSQIANLKAQSDAISAELTKLAKDA